MIRKLLTLSLLLIASIAAKAAMPTDTLVSMVTFYPGADIYELEGHSALRITTPRGDVALSYGMFDFNAPNFVYRFVKGETDYWVGAIPWDAFKDAYTGMGRRIVQQTLNLNSEQKQRLLDLASENLRPENCQYRYNYVKDNCATRPLRLVELAMGDSIILGKPSADIEQEKSFRDIMRHYHRNYPWYQFGIDLALGSGIDYTINNREKSFAPVILFDQLNGATVGGKKLVSSTTVIYDAPADAAVEGPTPWLFTPLSIFTLLLIIVAIVSVRDMRRGKLTRCIDTVLYGALGLTGCLIAFLVFVSTHEATTPNWLILWINPLCLIAAIGIWLKPAQKLVKWYQIVNFAAMLVFVVAVICRAQHINIAIFPIIFADFVRSACFLLQTRKKKQ
jgi:hypothetical protein